MNNCFYGSNPADCQHYPGCSNNIITTYQLNTGETRLLNQYGPCIIYQQIGSMKITFNGYTSLLDSPQFILVPDREAEITALSPVKVIVLGSDLIRLLADKLNIDYFQHRTVSKKCVRFVTLFDKNTAVKHSGGIITEYLGCRHYVEHKFNEIIHTIDPGKHDKIKRALTSKQWFFRIQIADLLKSCTSMEEFAYSMGLSGSGFSKAFKRIFGQSFYKWFLDRRFEAIVSDMVKTDLLFSEMADKHGFYSVQHFGYFIKKRTGLPPGVLKEKLKTESKISL